MYYRENISLRFSINFEAFASELLENLEEIFPRYTIYSFQNSHIAETGFIFYDLNKFGYLNNNNNNTNNLYSLQTLHD